MIKLLVLTLKESIYLDKWIKYGGRYPLILLRLWRKILEELKTDGWTNI